MLYLHDQGKKKHHSRFCLDCSYISSHEGMSTGLVLLPRNRCSVQVGTISAIKNPVPISAKTMCAVTVVLDGGRRKLVCVVMSSLYESNGLALAGRF